MLSNFRTDTTFLAEMLAQKSFLKWKRLRLDSLQAVTFPVLLRKGFGINLGACGVSFVFTAPCFQDVFSLLFVLDTQ